MTRQLPDSVQEALVVAKSDYSLHSDSEHYTAEGFLQELAACSWDAVKDNTPSVASSIVMCLCAHWIQRFFLSSDPWEIIIEQWKTELEGVHGEGATNEFNYLTIMRELGETARALLEGDRENLIRQIGLVGALGIKWWGDIPPINVAQDLPFLPLEDDTL